MCGWDGYGDILAPAYEVQECVEGRDDRADRGARTGKVPCGTVTIPHDDVDVVADAREEVEIRLSRIDALGIASDGFATAA